MLYKFTYLLNHSILEQVDDITDENWLIQVYLEYSHQNKDM